MTEPLSVEGLIVLGFAVILSYIGTHTSLRSNDSTDKLFLVITVPVLTVSIISACVGYLRKVESETGVQTEVYYPIKVFKNGDQTGTILVREGNDLIERKLEGSVDKIVETEGSPKVVCQGYEPYRRGGWTCTAYIKVEDLSGGSYTYGSGKNSRDVPVTDYEMED